MNFTQFAVGGSVVPGPVSYVAVAGAPALGALTFVHPFAVYTCSLAMTFEG